MAAIARVFPRLTKYTPRDDLAFVGNPDLFLPQIDEVHVSCVFTWDKPKAESLAREWSLVSSNVQVGGPAYGNSGGDFTPGMYVAPGYIVTSRGCPRRCPFCFVPEREGSLRELAIHEGNHVIDNNLLACSNNHIKAVFDMLDGQRGVTFTGGLDTRYLQDWHIERLVQLGRRLRYLYIAYDMPSDREYVKKSLRRMHEAGLKQDQLGVYVLVGYDDDTPLAADERCEWVFVNGGMPFAMYFRPRDEARNKKPEEWRDILNRWMWISTIYKHMKGEGLRYHDEFVLGKLVI